MIHGTGQQIAMTAVSTGGQVATWLAPASAAGPIGLAVAGVAMALSAIFSRKRPKQKIATTRIVDELEPILRENRDAYLNGPRTAADQAAALANFDAAWQWLTSYEACGNPQYGDPGRWCIEDRQRGGKWDWFARYRDPIAETPPVDAPGAAAGPLDTVTAEILPTGGRQIPPAALIGLALLAIGVML